MLAWGECYKYERSVGDLVGNEKSKTVTVQGFGAQLASECSGADMERRMIH